MFNLSLQSSIFKVAAFTVMGLLLFSQQFAEADDGHLVLNWDSRNLPGVELGASSEKMFGENIDPHLGGLGFNVVDVSIPGNFDIPVEIRRTISQGRKLHPSETAAFGDWELDVPRITSRYLGNGQKTTNRCSTRVKDVFDNVGIILPYYGGDINFIPVQPEGYGAGFALQIDGTSQELVDRRYGSNGGDFPTNATHATVTDWYFTCIPAKDGSEGFLGHAPNGKKYYFDQVITKRAVSSFYDANDTQRIATQVSLMVTRIEDRYGNFVNYEYTPNLGLPVEHQDVNGNIKLYGISSSDGRKISIKYLEGGYPLIVDGALVNPPFNEHESLITEIATNAQPPQVWKYRYDKLNFNFAHWERDSGNSSIKLPTLTKVRQPDGREWNYELDGMVAIGAPSDDCNRNLDTFQVNATSPYGAKLSIELKQKHHRMADDKNFREYERCTSPLSKGHTYYGLKSKKVKYASKISVSKNN